MSARGRFLLLCGLSAALFAALALAFDRDPAPPRSGAEGPSPRTALGAAEKASVRETLTLFNRIYQDFYATGGDPRLIDEMPATKEVKHQIFRDLGYLRDAGRILVMDEAQTLPVGLGGAGDGAAEATVYEEWNYVYQESGTRRPVTEVRGMGQGFRYSLRRRAGRWEIAGWEPVAMARPASPEGFVW